MEGDPPLVESFPGDPNPPAQQQNRNDNSTQLYSAPSMYYNRTIGRCIGSYTGPSNQGGPDAIRIVFESETPPPRVPGAQPYTGTAQDLRESQRANSRDIEDPNLLGYPRQTHHHGSGIQGDCHPSTQQRNRPNDLRYDNTDDASTVRNCDARFDQSGYGPSSMREPKSPYPVKREVKMEWDDERNKRQHGYLPSADYHRSNQSSPSHNRRDPTDSDDYHRSNPSSPSHYRGTPVERNHAPPVKDEDSNDGTCGITDEFVVFPNEDISNDLFHGATYSPLTTS